jgi:hypothetical protein
MIGKGNGYFLKEKSQIVGKKPTFELLCHCERYQQENTGRVLSKTCRFVRTA